MIRQFLGISLKISFNQSSKLSERKFLLTLFFTIFKSKMKLNFYGHKHFLNNYKILVLEILNPKVIKLKTLIFSDQNNAYTESNRRA